MSLEGLEALRTRFRERAADDLTAIEAWIAAGGPASHAIERMIHNLAGAAGTFGFADLHAAAATIDDSLCAGEVVRPEDSATLVAALRALRPHG